MKTEKSQDGALGIDPGRFKTLVALPRYYIRLWPKVVLRAHLTNKFQNDRRQMEQETRSQSIFEHLLLGPCEAAAYIRSRQTSLH